MLFETLVKDSLVRELNLQGNPVDFRLTTMNNVSRESGRSHHLYVQGVDQKDVIEIPNALSIKIFFWREAVFQPEVILKNGATLMVSVSLS